LEVHSRQAPQKELCRAGPGGSGLPLARTEAALGRTARSPWLQTQSLTGPWRGGKRREVPAPAGASGGCHECGRFKLSSLPRSALPGSPRLVSSAGSRSLWFGSAQGFGRRKPGGNYWEAGRDGCR